ncbi:MAG: type II secretion system F family protein [Candidatus Omnitrophota bacterium]
MIAFFKFILPKFMTIFGQFGIELPLPTQLLFNAGKFLEGNFLLIIAGSIFLVGSFSVLIKRGKTKLIWEKAKLKLPIAGKMVLLTCLERFTSTVYILLDSGLPLIYTLEIAAKSVGNSVLEKSILAVKNKVRDGASLSDELSKLNIFPLLIAEMARVGEETGSMPQVFSKIATHYQKDLSARSERLVAVFEPAMIVFMGVGIGVMVISLFLPLFKMATMGDNF